MSECELNGVSGGELLRRLLLPSAHLLLHHHHDQWSTGYTLNFTFHLLLSSLSTLDSLTHTRIHSFAHIVCGFVICVRFAGHNKSTCVRRDREKLVGTSSPERSTAIFFAFSLTHSLTLALPSPAFDRQKLSLSLSLLQESVR